MALKIQNPFSIFHLLGRIWGIAQSEQFGSRYQKHARAVLGVNMMKMGFVFLAVLQSVSL